MRLINNLFLAFAFCGGLSAQTTFHPDSLNQREMPEVAVIAKRDRLLSGVPGQLLTSKPKTLPK